MSRFRHLFIVRATVIAGTIAMFLPPIDYFVRDSLHGALWSTYFLVVVLINGAFYAWLKSPTLWAAILGLMLLPHLALVRPEELMIGYIWAVPFPLAVLFVAGLRRGLMINATFLLGYAAVIALRGVPGVASHLSFDLIAVLVAVNACAMLYEFVRERHAQYLRHVTAIDGLTGVWNRRRFSSALSAEIARALRYNRPLTMIIFDVDHFKHINDHYGHPTGDNVLCQLAEIVCATIRSTDIFARLGGDEFALLLPECPAQGGEEHGGIQCAERIRQAIAEHDFGFGGPVRITLGVAELGEDDDEERLYQRADEALYEAKRKGRDTVAFHGHGHDRGHHGVAPT